jgi:hypothetical protein
MKEIPFPEMPDPFAAPMTREEWACCAPQIHPNPLGKVNKICPENSGAAKGTGIVRV